MKIPLPKIFGFFVGLDRRDKNDSGHQNYCVCGALMPKVESQKRELSLETPSRLQGIQ